MEKSPNDPLPAVQASEQRQGRQAEAERPSSARHNVLADMHAYKCRVAGNEAGGLLEEPIRKGSPTMKEPDRRSSAKSLSARVRGDQSANLDQRGHSDTLARFLCHNEFLSAAIYLRVHTGWCICSDRKRR